MSVVLYFYNVIWGVFCVTRGHIGVLFMCSFLFLVVPLSRLMCEVIVLYVACLPIGRASWFMYWSHDVCVLWVLCVMGLGIFLCYWVVGRVRVVLSVDRASSRMVLMRR